MRRTRKDFEQMARVVFMPGCRRCVFRSFVCPIFVYFYVLIGLQDVLIIYLLKAKVSVTSRPAHFGERNISGLP